MKHQALFSLKDESKKIKCCLLQFLFGALRVKMDYCISLAVRQSVFFPSKTIPKFRFIFKMDLDVSDYLGRVKLFL